MSDDSTPNRLDEFDTLDDFLLEEGSHAAALAHAVKAVVATMLERERLASGLTKTAMAAAMGTSRMQLDRILDPTDFNTSISSLARAASAVGCNISLELVPMAATGARSK